jgi:lipopolysaccharide transport system ATP-binding protein
MFVRLAFSVAVHLEPEILVIDEVLAVGDAQFQKKCLAKMQDVSRGEGRTVLFVSHNMQAVSTLTSRCVLLRHGRCVMQGTPQEAIAAYLEDGVIRGKVYEASPLPDAASVTRVEVETSEPGSTHIHAKPLRVMLEVTTPTALPSPVLHFQIVDALLQPVVHLMLLDANRDEFGRAPGVYRVVCEIPRLRLYLGRYTITTHLEEAYGTWVHYQTLEGLCPFEVVMYGFEREWPWQEGRCRYLEDGEWSVEHVSHGQRLPDTVSSREGRRSPAVVEAAPA